MKPIAIFPGDSCAGAHVMRPMRDTYAASALRFVVMMREELTVAWSAAPLQRLVPDSQPRLRRCCNEREQDRQCGEAPNHFTAADRVFHSCLRFMPVRYPA